MRSLPGLIFALLQMVIVCALLIATGARAQTPAERADSTIDDMKTYRLVSENRTAVARIQRVFRKVERAANSFDKSIAGRFRVLVVNTPEYAHAESHANGVIVITEAFAAFPEADIAFVLAHELAHEALDHPRLQALLSDQIRGQESPASFQLRIVFGMLPQAVTDHLRSDEMAADATACVWLQRAHFSFDGAAFFQRMGRQPAANPAGSATHPSYSQRIDNLQMLGCTR